MVVFITKPLKDYSLDELFKIIKAVEPFDKEMKMTYQLIHLKNLKYVVKIYIYIRPKGRVPYEKLSRVVKFLLGEDYVNDDWERITEATFESYEGYKNACIQAVEYLMSNGYVAKQYKKK